MSQELLITDLASVARLLRLVAKKRGISISALVDAGGVTNGSLTSIATGNTRQKDMTIGPLLRVLRPVGYETVGRTIDPRGILLKAEGAAEMLVLGPDGGRLEVLVEDMDDVSVLLNTMAAANGRTMTGLARLTGVTSTSLVQIARKTGPNTDLRLGNLTRLMKVAGFELIARPQHRTRREARLALIAAARG